MNEKLDENLLRKYRGGGRKNFPRNFHKIWEEEWRKWRITRMAWQNGESFNVLPWILNSGTSFVTRDAIWIRETDEVWIIFKSVSSSKMGVIKWNGSIRIQICYSEGKIIVFHFDKIVSIQPALSKSRSKRNSEKSLRKKDKFSNFKIIFLSIPRTYIHGRNTLIYDYWPYHDRGIYFPRGTLTWVYPHIRRGLHHGNSIVAVL